MSDTADLLGAKVFFRNIKTRKLRLRMLKREKLKELQSQHPFTVTETLRPQAKEWAETSLEAMEQLVHRDG